MLAERPSMHSLHDVIQRVAPCSHDIAVELGLNEYNQIVETDHPTNCVLRCRKIFEKFLEGANPTWGKVINSIRVLHFIAIANDIEKQLPGKSISQCIVNINHFIAEILDEEEMRCIPAWNMVCI